MLWTEKMFGVKKPIISMLHLDALPGDPRFHYGALWSMLVRTCMHCRMAVWTALLFPMSSACPMSVR